MDNATNFHNVNGTKFFPDPGPASDKDQVPFPAPGSPSQGPASEESNRPLNNQLPTMSQNQTNSQQLRNQFSNSSPLPLTNQQTIKNQHQVSSQHPHNGQYPVSSQHLTNDQHLTRNQHLVNNQHSPSNQHQTSNQYPVTSQHPINNQYPISSQSSVNSQPPTNYQNLVNSQNLVYSKHSAYSQHPVHDSPLVNSQRPVNDPLLVNSQYPANIQNANSSQFLTKTQQSVTYKPVNNNQTSLNSMHSVNNQLSVSNQHLVNNQIGSVQPPVNKQPITNSQQSPHVMPSRIPYPPVSNPSQRPSGISQQYPKMAAYPNSSQFPSPAGTQSKPVAQPPLFSPNATQGTNQQKSPYVPYNGTPSSQSQQPMGNQHYSQQQPQYTSNQNYNSNFLSRYPQQPSLSGPGMPQMPNTNVVQGGMNKAWGMDIVDLLKTRDILPPQPEEPPLIRFQQEMYNSVNCSPDIFRCTLTKIPETKSLLDKSRLPLGVLIHPFKDLTQLTVIQSSVIVRCRACRTYINPFIHFIDNKHWKCNLCFRVNELPDEFQYDPTTKTYGDPSRRPEIKAATIEFIAPSEYMVRPPQPAVYLFLLDVSRLATQSGYLTTVCETLLSHLDNLPGDARTAIGFITYDDTVHFYSLAEGLNQPHQMTVIDVEDIFLPCPDNLLVNLNECGELVRDLLNQLPEKFSESFSTQSALGAALQAGFKLLAPTGGRITVFQACLPNFGPGSLVQREDPALRATENVPHLNPHTDFYKKLALDCSAQQIAVDLFIVNSQYVDIATLSGISKFSGGSIHHIPLYSSVNPAHVENLEKIFTRYLTRKIGFESVMRLRCTRGLSIHTFHGNFFVRSTDLLSLPNVNPDAGYGMQVSIDENLSDMSAVCFQAALLYTSSKGERRIRVHTLCLPVVSSLTEVLHSADQQCIIGLLSKMAVDRSVQTSLSDAREAFVNAVTDILSTFKMIQSYSEGSSSLLAPHSLRLLPLYVLALLKYVAFRTGKSTRLDDRVFAMCQMKCLPLSFLIQAIYPDLYPVHYLEQVPEVEVEDRLVPQPPRLQLSSERIETSGIYLMDSGDSFILYVGHNASSHLCSSLLGVPHFSSLPDVSSGLPELDTPESERLRNFITALSTEKPYIPPVTVLRDNSPFRALFLERLVEDKYESGISYYEFLQRIKGQVK